MRYLSSEPDKIKNVERGNYLIIAHLVTADMDDGQPLPPFYERDAVWCVVRRLPDQKDAVAAPFPLTPTRADIAASGPRYPWRHNTRQ